MADAVYLSNPEFSLLRSYVPGLAVGDALPSFLELSGNLLIWTTLTYTVICPVREDFIPWSSSCYKLSTLFDVANAELFISGEPYTGAWGLFVYKTYVTDAPGTWPALSLFTPLLHPFLVELAHEPASYWLPTAWGMA